MVKVHSSALLDALSASIVPKIAYHGSSSLSYQQKRVHESLLFFCPNPEKCLTSTSASKACCLCVNSLNVGYDVNPSVFTRSHNIWHCVPFLLFTPGNVKDYVFRTLNLAALTMYYQSKTCREALFVSRLHCLPETFACATLPFSRDWDCFSRLCASFAHVCQ